MEQIDFISRKGYNELRHVLFQKAEKYYFIGYKTERIFYKIMLGWHNNLSLGKIGSLLYQPIVEQKCIVGQIIREICYVY